MGRIVLDKVSKSFGETEVIPPLDLTIEEGEFAVFVGPSGCGKSTLLRMVAGLEETTAGSIIINDRDVTHAEPSERGIAMVFQTYALYPHMTVRENMGFGLKMNKVPKEEIARKVAEAAKILKLEDYLDRKPAALSGGQRQRVAIGRAITRGPDVFLFDEPLSNLDAELRVGMRVEIARLHKELGATMIYVTHDQVEAMTLADKIVVLRNGLIEQTGTPMQLYQDPDNMFVAGFIGSPAMNFLKGIVTKDGVEIPALGNRRIKTKLDLPDVGCEVTVGIRPQDISIVFKKSAITLDIRERLGGVSYDYLTAPTGERIIAEVKDDAPADEGSTVAVEFPKDRVFLFDTNTQQRIR